ncbi:alpha/beta hydrolase family protein [Brevibacillus daliensis]|uniref:alpha/beta hydrolase family protein n=1 Tax=Brevibacillus daliensis TaxID=2892995 RepID=UPI001E56353C|nr:alpha/beta fold hydrolase [Brevibacillus daliensis]
MEGIITAVREEKQLVDGVNLYTIQYKSGSFQVKALLAIHSNSESDALGEQTKSPAILYCRGGYKKVGQVNPLRISQMAAFGYTVLAPHYRGNQGGTGKDEFGGDDMEDVHVAYELLHEMSWVDDSRIHLYGFSRGGMMALRAAMIPDRYASVVVWSGVSDMYLTYEERKDLRPLLVKLVGEPDQESEGYDIRSPINYTEDISCPVLIIHGTEDENVGIEHAVRLANELKNRDKTYELWLAEGATHLFDSPYMEQYTIKMFSWLDMQEFRMNS